MTFTLAEVVLAGTQFVCTVMGCTLVYWLGWIGGRASVLK